MTPDLAILSTTMPIMMILNQLIQPIEYFHIFLVHTLEKKTLISQAMCTVP